jgi:signal transduction histidine kinase
MRVATLPTALGHDPPHADEMGAQQLDPALREVLEDSATCIFETGADLRFTRLLGPVESVTGCDAGALIDTAIEDLAANPDSPESSRAICELRARRPFQDLVLKLDSPAGPRFLRMNGRPRFDAGSFRGYKGAITDVTVQAMAERRAATQYSGLAEALESVPASVTLFDAEDRLVFCNSATKDFFPKANERLVPGTRFEDLLRTDIVRGHLWRTDMGVEAFVRDRVERHQRADSNVIGERPDGRWVQVIERRTTDGAIIGVRIDVTEQKHREAELKQKSEQLEEHSRELQRSNAELEQFAYVASHDLQEPLRMVAGYCQLLQRRYQDKLGTEGNEFIDFAVEAAVRMQQLINGLLNFSRIGRSGRELCAVNVGDAAAAAIANLQGAIGESGARIELGDLPAIFGDRALVAQLLQNLIGNAIKFRREAPVIRIGATREEDFWHFLVEDNGIGIEAEYVERVFLIFQRLHGRDKYPGTGIGLAVVKKVVEYHGGRIWIESTPGEGSRFHFTLPAAKETCADG